MLSIYNNNEHETSTSIRYLSTNAEKQTRYIQHDNFFCFNANIKENSFKKGLIQNLWSVCLHICF
jgi:hypothetical protein